MSAIPVASGPGDFLRVFDAVSTMTALDGPLHAPLEQPIFHDEAPTTGWAYADPATATLTTMDIAVLDRRRQDGGMVVAAALQEANYTEDGLCVRVGGYLGGMQSDSPARPRVFDKARELARFVSREQLINPEEVFVRMSWIALHVVNVNMQELPQARRRRLY